jgi:hypothetical protein
MTPANENLQPQWDLEVMETGSPYPTHSLPVVRRAFNVDCRADTNPAGERSSVGTAWQPAMGTLLSVPPIFPTTKAHIISECLVFLFLVPGIESPELQLADLPLYPLSIHVHSHILCAL